MRSLGVVHDAPGFGRGVQGHADARERALRGATGLIRAQRAIHAIDALVIPRMPHRAGPMPTLPKSPAGFLRDQRQRRVDNRRVAVGCALR